MTAMSDAADRREAVLRKRASDWERHLDAPRPSNADMVFILRRLDEARATHGPLIEAARAELVKLHERRVAELQDDFDRWKAACRESGICMSCAGGQSMQPCTDCLGTGWDGGAPPGYVEIFQLRAAWDANNALLERARAAEDECRMLSDQVTALDAKLAELSEWRPIETAPKDGSKILLLGVEGEREVGHWNPNGDSWADADGNPCPSGVGTIQVTGYWFAGGAWFQPNEVVGWLPLPEPPHD